MSKQASELLKEVMDVASHHVGTRLQNEVEECLSKPSPQVVWEEVKSNHGEYMSRAKIVGGWLVKCTCDAELYLPDRGITTSGFRTSLTFVPDPNHQWQ